MEWCLAFQRLRPRNASRAWHVPGSGSQHAACRVTRLNERCEINKEVYLATDLYRTAHGSRDSVAVAYSVTSLHAEADTTAHLGLLQRAEHKAARTDCNLV